jgi:4-hydroxy-tetrahydrodipicolinate reductase
VRVGVFGATGRMGQASCKAVLGAGDMDLAAVAGRSAAGSELRGLVGQAPAGLMVDDLDGLVRAKLDVVVDFSKPDATMAAARALLPAGTHLVSGTTGLPDAAFEELRRLAGGDGGNVVWAPNFALGAVLAMHFAAIAARWYRSAEVIELHHDRKVDAPSGTALRTARAIAAVRATSRAARGGDAHAPSPATAGEASPARGQDVDGVQVHAVRLPGLVAHQEVVFGGEGELLTIRHDSLDRASFMPGVLLAVREVPTRPGLTTGLEPLLGLTSA